MKNIIRFLSKHKMAILLVICLLIVQAYCDLSLPNYTSDVLNIGLQQGGIENAVLDTVRDESLELLKLFASDEDEKMIDSSYSSADSDGIRKLKDDANRDELNTALQIPECTLYQLGHSKDANVSIDQIQAALKSGMMTKEQLRSKMQEGMEKMSGLTDTYLNQIAVMYVSEEYEAQGVDLDEIQRSYLFKAGFAMLAMAFVMMAAAIIIGLVASRTSAQVGRELRRQIYTKVMGYTKAEMEKFSTASLITRSTNDIQQVQMVIVLFLRMVAYAPILAIGGIIKVFQTKSGMSWIIALAVAILAACVGVLMAVAMPKFKQMQKLVDRLNLVSRELLTGIMPIRAFSREKYEEERFDAANQDLFATQLFTNRTMTFMLPIMMFVMNGISVLIVWIGAHKVDSGTVQVGDLTAFITYSMVIVMGFLMLAMISIILPRAGVAADRIQEVLDTPITLEDPKEPKDILPDNSKGEVEFHDVSFRYPDAEEYMIKDISFTAKPGQTTAIIGPTGSGKSTVINLIPRFFDVTKGSITIDGVDIRDMTQKSLRNLVGYVPQKGVLFSGTIQSNIKYADDEISDAEMTRAARIAQAEEFIDAKADKYSSAIAQGGSNVSGGQKQRLSIARAIAKHPKIFLFDDSFSALDFKTDVALRKALYQEINSATIIIVAQRISTILNADQIIVMEDGNMVGIGTHEELLKNCEVYKEIAKSQLSDEELKKGGVK